MRLCAKPGCIVEVPKRGYCPPHLAEYMRQYRTDTARRAFRKGFEAFRALAIAQFERVNGGQMNGHTAAAIVRTLELSAKTP